MHQPEDPKDLIIFDVNPHKKGFLSPKEFLDLFGHLSVAELIYSGNVGKEFIQSVKEETIDIESRYKIRAEIPEGVVCKGGKGHRLWMSKIKTERYKAALKVNIHQIGKSTGNKIKGDVLCQRKKVSI